MTYMNNFYKNAQFQHLLQGGNLPDGLKHMRSVFTQEPSNSMHFRSSGTGHTKDEEHCALRSKLPKKIIVEETQLWR